MAGAEVSILGWTGTQRTDADGRFTWQPSPAPPFEVLVVLPGGRYMKPFPVGQLPESGPVVISLEPLAEEAVTVTAGAAPTIESAPANGMTIVRRRTSSRASRQSRQARRMSRASFDLEGQAAVPAIGGRARTLRHFDRWGPGQLRAAGRAEAAYVPRPFLLEGIEVRPRPGSVAYGSDAVEASSRCGRERGAGRAAQHRATGDYGVGIPGGRGGVAVSAPIGEDGGFSSRATIAPTANWTARRGES